MVPVRNYRTNRLNRSRNGFKSGRGSRRMMGRVQRPMKATGYDGQYFAKINIVADVLFNDAAMANGFFCISWGAPYSGTVGYGADIRDSAEFTALAAVFNFYRINGLKIKYFPAGNISGTTAVAYFDTEVASFADKEVALGTG